MTGKLIGVLLIICGCGGMGFAIVAAYKQEEAALRQLIGGLDFMECELQYHLTPLPELCRRAGTHTKGVVGRILCTISQELDNQISPDVCSCVRAALTRCGDMPRRIRKAFEILGTSLGRFDLEGQIRGLETVRGYCRGELEALASNRDNRLRSYQTLSLCAGAALAILFV